MSQFFLSVFIFIYIRTVMGARGSNVQEITTDFNVQNKFPDKAVENDGAELGNHVNGDGRSSNPNITKITGRTENCAPAAQAVLELVPATAEVPVPFEFTGQKGTSVCDMMNKFDINIGVPGQDVQSDVILISGVPSNVEAVKGGLAEKVAELENEKQEKLQKPFEVKVKVNPDYHPKIIGRGGAVISKIRDDFDVQIQLPRMEAEDTSIITITGYEKNATEARDAILKIVGQFEGMVHEEVSRDPRVHSMIQEMRDGTGAR